MIPLMTDIRPPRDCGAASATIPNIRLSTLLFREEQPMRFGIMAVPFAACVAALFALLDPVPAFAGYGALAHGEKGGNYALSSNEETQSKAEQAALKGCGENCKIIFRTAPRECGAVATPENGNSWGAGKRRQRPAAELDAIQNCQKRTKEQCKIREVKCNNP
jgi:hypothetical protein